MKYLFFLLSCLLSTNTVYPQPLEKKLSSIPLYEQLVYKQLALPSVIDQQSLEDLQSLEEEPARLSAYCLSYYDQESGLSTHLVPSRFIPPYSFAEDPDYIAFIQEHPNFAGLESVISSLPASSLNKENVASILKFILLINKHFSPGISQHPDILLDMINKKEPYFLKINSLLSSFSNDFLLHLHDGEDLSDYADLSDLLKQSTLDPNAAFLTPPNGLSKTPFDIYDDVAQKIKALNNIHQNPHLPLFGHISALLLRHYLHTGSFIKKTRDSDKGLGKDLEVVNGLLEELALATSEQRCTYKWFLYFNKRMLISADSHTPPYSSRLYSNTSFTNESFDTLAHNCGYDASKRNCLKNQRDFEDFINHVGNFTYQQKMSPKGLSELYPHILTLPFPFDLTIEERFKATLFNQCAFWPLGFAFRNSVADGFNMPPHIFYERDLFHLGCSLHSNVLGFKRNEGTSNTLWEESDLSRFKQLALNRITVMNRLKETAYSIVQQEKDTFKKQIFLFYAFVLFHKNRAPIITTLKILLEPNFRHDFFSGDTPPFYTTSKYLPLLPLSIRESSDKDANHRVMTTHRDEFFNLIMSSLDDNVIRTCRDAASEVTLSDGSGENIADEYEPVFGCIVYSGYKAEEKKEHGMLFVEYKVDPTETSPYRGSEFFTNLNVFKDLEIDPKKPIEAQDYALLTFHSLLPDGTEIERTNPFWIETLHVLPGKTMISSRV